MMDLITDLISGFMRLLFAVLLGMAISVPALAQTSTDGPLSPDEAIQLSIDAAGPYAVVAHLTIAPGIHVYRDSIKAAVQLPDQTPLKTDVQGPAGTFKLDPVKHVQVAMYSESSDVAINWQPSSSRGVILSISYQGCADSGVCYPPVTDRIAIVLDSSGVATKASSYDELVRQAPSVVSPRSAPASSAVDPRVHTRQRSEQRSASQPDSILAAVALFPSERALLVFFLAGLVLAQTPCAFFMVPAIWSVSHKHSAGSSVSKRILISCAYSAGVGLLYVIAGGLASRFGPQFQAVLERPAGVLTLATCLLFYALSALGLYPATFCSTVAAGLTRPLAGRSMSLYAEAFVAGLASALFFFPAFCSVSFSAVTLLANHHGPLFGAVAMAFMVLGMSVVFAATALLSKVSAIRHRFFLLPLRLLAGAGTVALALWVAIPAYGVVASFLELPGSSSLEALLSVPTVSTEKQLRDAITLARATGQPTLLDFYSDSCEPCMAMERTTFKDPAAVAALRRLNVIRVDTSSLSAESERLMSMFSVNEAPSLVFLSPAAREIVAARLTGYVSADALVKSIAMVTPGKNR